MVIYFIFVFVQPFVDVKNFVFDSLQVSLFLLWKFHVLVALTFRAHLKLLLANFLVEWLQIIEILLSLLEAGIFIFLYWNFWICFKVAQSSDKILALKLTASVRSNTLCEHVIYFFFKTIV